MSTPSSPPQDVPVRRSPGEPAHDDRTPSHGGRRPPLRGLSRNDGILVSPREIVGNILSSGLSGSPLSRAGYGVPARSRSNIHSLDYPIFRLLQYGHHLHSTSSTPRPTFVPHSQNDIRTHTMQLSNVAISSSKTSHPSPSLTPSPFEQPLGYGSGSQTSMMPPPTSKYQAAPGTMPSSFKSTRLETVSPNLIPRTTTPSGLSLLLANRRAESLNQSPREVRLPGSLESSPSLTPQPRNEPVDLSISPSPIRAPPRTSGSEDPSPQLSEEVPLLAHNVVPNTSYSSVEAGLPHLPSMSKFRIRLASASRVARVRSRGLLATCVRSLPAVLLGVLLNILDGVSCKVFLESTL